MAKQTTTSKTKPKTETRKTKRAQRNKERLVNHQCKLLDTFAENLNAGFSDENWSNMAKLYKQISDFLAPEERKTLGQLWSRSYTSNVSPAKVNQVVDLLKVRLVGALEK